MHQKLTSFLSIQVALSQPSILVHHNLEKIFWIDLDAFKKFSFRAIIFYTTFGKTIPKRRWPYANTI